MYICKGTLIIMLGFVVLFYCSCSRGVSIPQNTTVRAYTKGVFPVMSGVKHHIRIIEPDPNIDYKILQIKPDPNIDYKLIIIDPRTGQEMGKNRLKFSPQK